LLLVILEPAVALLDLEKFSEPFGSFLNYIFVLFDLQVNDALICSLSDFDFLVSR
jgi:hypothetical protein